MDLGQDALHLLEIGPALGVEVHAPAPSLEQLGVQMLLQGADAVADGGGGNPELLAGQLDGRTHVRMFGQDRLQHLVSGYGYPERERFARFYFVL